MTDQQGSNEGIQRYAEDPFQVVRVEQKKLRMAIAGPAGCGKTFTGLKIASALAAYEKDRDPGSNGVAVLDTERGSAAFYRDQFEFKHLWFDPPYTPATYAGYIRAAYDWGYSALVIDSLSHAWFAPGGMLELVDRTRIRLGGDKNGAWYELNPEHNAMINAITSTPIHIIATLRAKQEWLVESDDGTSSVRRIGTSPVQRDGIEYEFQFYCDMDLDQRLVVTKARADDFINSVWPTPGEAFCDNVLGWLMTGVVMTTPAQRQRLAGLRDSLTDEERELTRGWIAEQQYPQPIGKLSATECDATIAAVEALIAARPDPEPPEPETATEGGDAATIEAPTVEKDGSARRKKT